MAEHDAQLVRHILLGISEFERENPVPIDVIAASIEQVCKLLVGAYEEYLEAQKGRPN